jgi:predicted metal-binding protein
VFPAEDVGVVVCEETKGEGEAEAETHSVGCALETSNSGTRLLGTYFCFFIRLLDGSCPTCNVCSLHTTRPSPTYIDLQPVPLNSSYHMQVIFSNPGTAIRLITSATPIDIPYEGLYRHAHDALELPS